MQFLRDVDADEVSPVRRGANRKKVVLKEEGVHVETEIADIMAVPWEREGAMVDELRKADVDDTVLRGAVGAMRLLSGIADELPDSMREAVEKLGSEMYPRLNPPLNTTGAPSPGGLDGDSAGAPKDGGAGKQTDLEGPGRDGELEGSGAGKKVAADACDDMDEDGVYKGDKPYGDVTYADPGYQSDKKARYPIDTPEHVRAAWSYINKPANAGKYSSGDLAKVKGKIKARMSGLGANVAKEDEEILELAKSDDRLFSWVRKALGLSKEEPDTGDEPDGDEPPPIKPTEAVEKGGTVETHAVPIQKEDGSWDLSGVPDDARPFYQSMITKADETAAELVVAKADLATTRETLRDKEIIEKAETQFKAVGAQEDLVTVLKEANDKLTPEGYESLVSLLSAANERIEKGDLFAEAGRTAFDEGAGGDSWAKIEKAADDLVEKSDTGMTREQAIDRVMKTPEGAALYSAYMAENGLGVS